MRLFGVALAFLLVAGCIESNPQPFPGSGVTGTHRGEDGTITPEEDLHTPPTDTTVAADTISPPEDVLADTTAEDVMVPVDVMELVEPTDADVLDPPDIDVPDGILPDIVEHDSSGGPCQSNDDCAVGEECCSSMFGASECKPAGQCEGLPFGCNTDGDCDGGMICCDFGGMKVCMPESMCIGEPGGCAVDGDCVEGQVCCKFGDLAGEPLCMAEPMCPKNCIENGECGAAQECCDLGEQMVCIDLGQCPEQCLYSADCPAGQQCCDGGEGTLFCVPAAECPQPVGCEPGSVCTNSEGEPNGFECCDVPVAGNICVGSGGCGEWQNCDQNSDCPVGRECCVNGAGPQQCLPVGACLAPPIDFKPCQAKGECAGIGEVCCILPGEESPYCVPAEECPSECLEDVDCGDAKVCCKLPDNPAMCTPAAECVTGAACEQNSDCAADQECCDMLGQKMCVPEGQCFGGSCDVKEDCPDEQDCCDMAGQKMCLPVCVF
jgi:hypothetical protein